MYTLKRDVGVELEITIPYDNAIRLERYLSELDNKCMTSSPTEDLYRCRVNYSGDGSIRAQGGYTGIEIKMRCTPKGFALIIPKVCDKLKEWGAEVNASTGFHVHVNTPELVMTSYVSLVPSDDMRRVVRFPSSFGRNSNPLSMALDVMAMEYNPSGDYRKRKGAECLKLYVQGSENPYEQVRGELIYKPNTFRRRLNNALLLFSAIDPVLLSLIPSTRRSNNYCNPFSLMTKSGGGDNISVKDALYSVERYAGINIQSLERHGTIECRYHSGTINAVKIQQWCAFFAAIVEIAVGQSAQQVASSLLRKPEPQEKLETLLNEINGTLRDSPRVNVEYFIKRYNTMKERNSGGKAEGERGFDERGNELSGGQGMEAVANNLTN